MDVLSLAPSYRNTPHLSNPFWRASAGLFIVDLRINETLPMNSQPPKSPTPLPPHDKGGWQGGRLLAPLVRGVEGKDKGRLSLTPNPLIRGLPCQGSCRGTLKISRRLKLLVNVSLSLVFTINSPNLSLIGLTVAIYASYTDGQNSP